jgi:hypothetical protein
MNDEERKAYNAYVASMTFVALGLAITGISIVGYMVWEVLRLVVELINI